MVGNRRLPEQRCVLSCVAQVLLVATEVLGNTGNKLGHTWERRSQQTKGSKLKQGTKQPELTSFH